jgi:hypothetical protein
MTQDRSAGFHGADHSDLILGLVDFGKNLMKLVDIVTPLFESIGDEFLLAEGGARGSCLICGDRGSSGSLK